MALGRIIRDRKLNTSLGAEYTEEMFDNAQPEGYRIRMVAKDVVCASACTLAFIGGRVRELENGAMLGVHQFSSTIGRMDESSTQVTVTALAEYVSEMGVDRRMIDIASITPSKSIFWIEHADARRYRIDNTVAPLNDWKVTVDKDGVPTVQTHQEISPGHRISLFLQQQSQGSIRLTLITSFDHIKTHQTNLQDFPLNDPPNIHMIFNDVQDVKLSFEEPWQLGFDKRNDLSLFIVSALLTTSDIESFRHATSLKIHDYFPSVLSDMSITTQLSTKNLGGGIELLLRSR